MLGYFHTDSARDIEWLENVLRTAREGGRSVRLHTEGGRLKVKVGEGGWTPPIAGTLDPYRDAPVDLSQRPLGEAQHESHDLSHWED